MRTFTLEQYARILFAIDKDAEVPQSKLDWLVRRLRRGELDGFKAGRQWVATEDDVAAAIEKLRPRVTVPQVPAGGLTRTSRRRLAG